MLRNMGLYRTHMPKWGVLAASSLIALIAAALAIGNTLAQTDQLVLKVAKEYDVAIAGEQRDWFGYGLSVGDINGDGQADLLVGAPESDLDSRFRSGAAFGFLGPIDSTVSESSAADIKLKGFDVTAGIGSAVLIQDINGDNVADFLISSEEMGVDDTRHESGLIYVVLGPIQPTGASATELNDQAADFRILGPHRNYNTGKGLATGDVNNDGALDIAIGSPGGYGSRKGGVEIVLGPLDGSDIDLRDGSDVKLLGSIGTIGSTRNGDAAGGSIAIGDINNDGVDDIAVNSRSADVGGIENAGETHIIFGPLDPSALGELATQDEEGGIPIKSIADVTLQGEQERDNASASTLAIGDLDGDGINDLIVGSMQSDAAGSRAAGKVFVIKGPILSGIYNLDDAADVAIEGENPIDSLGSGIGVGDLNGDGVADLALAANFADPQEREDAGIAYIMFGNIFEREPTPEESNLPQILIGVVVVIVVIAAAAGGLWYLRRTRRGAMPPM
ncbi:MAG: hypothetical protein F4X72_04480 [Dehalococcoidia bacterium]|nr:hypothetical protein [Dehalococcoidia bacterium]